MAPRPLAALVTSEFFHRFVTEEKLVKRRTLEITLSSGSKERRRLVKHSLLKRLIAHKDLHGRTCHFAAAMGNNASCLRYLLSDTFAAEYYRQCLEFDQTK